jgi:hypothetical protein
MSKKKKLAALIFPLIFIIVLFSTKFWAQEECDELLITFAEGFDTLDFKDEAKSAVSHWGEGYITLGLAGIFQQIPRSANVPTWVNMIAFGDFDMDGLDDFIGTSDAACKDISFIKNLGDGTFQELTPFIREGYCSTQINSLLGGDFDGDGDPDFMFVLSEGGAGDPVSPIQEVRFYEHDGWVDGNGVPQFTARNYTSQLASDLEGLGWSATHHTIDIDGDEDLDILFSSGHGKVILLRNDGTKPLSDTTKFTSSVLINARDGESGHRWDEKGISTLGTGDFDGDEDVDIIIGAVNWRGLKYYKNDGTGNFTLHDVMGDLSSSPDLDDDYYDGASTAITVADYDMDGDLDFLIGTDNWNPQEAYPPYYEYGSTVYSSACHENYQTGTGMGAKVYYFRNDGTGEFDSTIMFNGHQLLSEGECAPWDFDFGLPMDYDGDGDMDSMIFDGNHSEFYYFFENIIYNRFNTDGVAVSTNVTVDSYPPNGLDQEENAITKVQFTQIDQTIEGSDSDGLKVTYYVSNDGGRTWEFYAEFEEDEIQNCSDLPLHTFSTFGADLRWKAEMSAPNDYPDPTSEYHGTSNDSPRINLIQLEFYFVEKKEYSRTSVATTVTTQEEERIKLIIGSSFYFPGFEGHLRAYDVTGMTLTDSSYSMLKTVTRPDLGAPSGREIVPEGVDILWDAGELLNSRSPSDRTIYTATPVDSVLTRIELTVANVDTLGPILEDVNNDNEGLINFVRGEGRDWKLGDSNHSNPIVVGPPEETPGQMGAGYDAFKTTWEDRTKVLYLGSNDGMLHCFNVLTGEEMWSFIPYNLLPKLKNMWAVDDTTGDRFFLRNVYVDGSPVAADVYIDDEWKTILICGQGPGKGSVIGGGLNYYFALDVTDPDDPQPLWEFSDDRLGETWSIPEVGKIVKDGYDTWAAFTGSGYDNNPDFEAGNVFYVIDIATGDDFWTFEAPDVDTSASYTNIPNCIPGSPSIIDTDQDGYTDRVYVGDLDGRVWKVDVSPDYVDSGSWSEVQLYEDPDNYPIISNTAVWLSPSMTVPVPRLYFGTGGDDDAPDDGTYSFIALMDGDVPEIEWYIGDSIILGLDEAKGVGDLDAGEKVWADPKVSDNIVYFSTFAGSIESVDPCENIAGAGKLYARFIQPVAGTVIGGTAFKTAGGPTESLGLTIKTRAAVTMGERERTEGGVRKREVYIQEYDSTIQKLEQTVGALLKIKSWREIYKIIK